MGRGALSISDARPTQIARLHADEIVAILEQLSEIAEDQSQAARVKHLTRMAAGHARAIVVALDLAAADSGEVA